MLESYRNIHFIGIGGAGMSALAHVLAKRGYNVSGSDLNESAAVAALREAGAKIFVGHDPSNIEGAQAVVVSTAIHRENPELMAAKFSNMPVFHRSDVLADLLNAEGVSGVAVAGSHGKSTTSAMVSVIAVRAGADPTIVIGGGVKSIGGNARNGSGKFVVAEADESDGSFLKFRSAIAIVTNIENDHLDHYGTEENIFQAFRQFLSNMKEGGKAVLCMDSPKVRRLAKETEREFVTYGFDEGCDYCAKNIRYGLNGTDYDVFDKTGRIMSIHLQIPGRHNVLNSLGAAAAAFLMGIDKKSIADALADFGGVKRRFETKGRTGGVWIVDDYAHHPTEIAVTLKAAGQTGARRVICVFQPHRYTRTKILHDEFCTCFKDCDELVMTHLYSAGEDALPGVTAENLARDVERATGQKVTYIDDFKDVLGYLLKKASAGDLIMTMGAGDVYKIGEALAQKLQATVSGQDDMMSAGKGEAGN